MADKTGPRKRSPRKPEGSQILIQEPEYQISFDSPAFDAFVKSQGIWVTHHRAIPDPRGMASRGDTRAVLDGKPQDSDGFIYKKVEDLQVTFTNNSTYVQHRDLGELSVSTAYITLPKQYPKSKKEVLVHPWDKFYLKDIEIRVVNLQYMEARREGVDRLQYPAVSVEELVDTNGVWYEQDKDFKLTKEGHIKWLSQKRPGWNEKTGKGTVFSIRYKYTPYFVVNRVLHEIRVSQITNPATFQRSLERMPYQVEVVREFVFKDKNNHPGSPDLDIRYQSQPQVGGNTGPIGVPSVGGLTGPKPHKS